LRRYAEALLPGFVGLYHANAQSPRSLTGRGEGGGVLTVDGETAKADAHFFLKRTPAHQMNTDK
jgi:hypothetical protein